jgi:DNA-binding transcriptional LysR family regulator
MDKFQSLQIFAAVVDRGSFIGAAKKLGISAASVTKKIVALEDELKVQLFTRTTRKVVVTPYGVSLYDRCVDILRRLEDAEAAMRQMSESASGRVRMILPYSFGRVTVVPELPAFREANPNIELEIHFNEAPVDLIAERFDLAVRSRELDDSRFVRRILNRGPTVTVASRSYINRYGTVHTPHDLQHHNCIISKFGNEWDYVDKDGNDLVVRVKGSVRLFSGDASREAAVAGLGVARSTYWLFRKDLEEGTVVPLLASYERQGVPISVIYPANRHLAKEVKVVIDFLKRITRLQL